MATLFNSISVIILALGLITNSMTDAKLWKVNLLLTEKVVTQEKIIENLITHNAELGQALGIPAPIWK